eukprot:TRINITY_DN32916_c0_g1_i1.p1 TRINITY_DN32916_c0_g1~~TRINITY_DN32916_c0_g1_i1.p1  ORF type:complete len:600 (+),score=133.32 TRINITY_DN32916_c0_g1_i1:80-1879(+)
MGQGGSVGGSWNQERYFLQKVKLGQGTFGTVWRAVDRQTNTPVAVKQLDKAALPKRGMRRSDIEREVSIMQAVSHDNVTKLHTTWEDSQSIFLVLEYCNGGDFGDKVKERGMALEEREAAEWVFQILSAISVLHATNICHRDIKPDNFMVHDEVLKLADFGLSVKLSKGSLLNEKCGTPAFMSPEQHQLPRFSKGYNHAADVWAAGITMYMLMFGGKHPFLNGQKLDEPLLLTGQLDFSVGQGGFFNFGVSNSRYSEKARRLCRWMVMPDVNRRVSAEKARKDAWFQEQGVGRRSRPTLVREAPRPAAALASPSAGSQDVPSSQPSAKRMEEQPSSETSREAPGLSWWPFGGREEDMSQGRADPASPSRTRNHSAEVGQQQHLRSEENEQILKQRIEFLQAQVRLQNEQNESQWEALVQNSQMMQQLLKDKQQLAALQAEGAVPLGAQLPSHALGVSRKQTQVFGDSSANVLESPHVPAIQTLRAGMRCRYWSLSYGGWLPGVVQQQNQDGTFDLDIKQHASLDNISPAPDVAGPEAWPPGTSVLYKSNSAQRWLMAVVQSFNAGTGYGSAGTYNLDVKACAECDRIRPRLLKFDSSVT